MFGWHYGLGFVSVVFMVSSCGGRIGDGDVTTSGGAADAAGAGGAPTTGGAGAHSGGTSSSFGGRAASGGESASGGSVYVDPGCPDTTREPGIIECDPLDPENGCADGYGCYPYVEHPFGSGCGTETFGAICVEAGTGTQGALCGDDSGPCAAGFVCVIGARAGRRCARLCRPGEDDTCPRGSICEDTDVQGYGVCD